MATRDYKPKRIIQRPDLLTPREAAKLAGISASGFYHQIYVGHVEVLDITGGVYIVTEKALADFISKRKAGVWTVQRRKGR